MKSEIKFVTPNKVPVPTADDIGALTIADWFASDIQYSEMNIDEWINVFSDVASGNKKSGYQGTGNANSIMVVDDWIYIENEFIEDQKVFLNRKQISDALEKYREFLKSDYKNNTKHPDPFFVEYEAVGKAALDRYLDTGGSLGA